MRITRDYGLTSSKLEHDLLASIDKSMRADAIKRRKKVQSCVAWPEFRRTKMKIVSKDEHFRESKKALMRYRTLMEKVARMEERLEQIDRDLMSIKSPALSSEPKTSVRITLEDKLIRKDELESKINSTLKFARQNRADIMRCIDALENQKSALVLERYFIDSATLETIADEMHYSYEYVKQLYVAGVKSAVVNW